MQSATDIDGAHVPLSRYAGRLVIVANVASEDHARGYTSQNYARLNWLYEKYKPKGVEVWNHFLFPILKTAPRRQHLADAHPALVTRHALCKRCTSDVASPQHISGAFRLAVHVQGASHKPCLRSQIREVFLREYDDKDFACRRQTQASNQVSLHIASQILAFPCNQFGGLEPGSNAEIKDKVRNTYNATFPLFSKVRA